MRNKDVDSTKIALPTGQKTLQQSHPPATVKAKPFPIDLSLFSAGFAVSILFLGLLCGFSLVNYHAYRSGRPDYAPIFTAKSSYAEYTVSIFGKNLYLDRDWARQRESLGERLSVLMPTQLRVLLCQLEQSQLGLLQLLGVESVPPLESLPPLDAPHPKETLPSPDNLSGEAAPHTPSQDATPPGTTPPDLLPPDGADLPPNTTPPEDLPVFGNTPPGNGLVPGYSENKNRVMEPTPSV